MLTVLYRNFPDAATTDDLVLGIWGSIKAGPPLSYNKIIQVYANMIRMVLQDHLKVINEYGGNYRMVWRDVAVVPLAGLEPAT